MSVIAFQLVVDDGWPPVAAEAMECTEISGNFCIETPPLFLKGMSVGDVIAAAPDDEGRVWTWSHVRKSSHSTIWLARLEANGEEQIENVLKELRSIGCRTTVSSALGCSAVDVPPNCDFAAVDKILESLDSEDVAVAFPSYRHEDA